MSSLSFFSFYFNLLLSKYPVSIFSPNKRNANSVICTDFQSFAFRNKFSINRVDKTASVFYVLLLSNIVCTLASHYSETKAKAQYQQLLNFLSNCCHVARGRHSYFIYSISASVRFQLYFIHLSHNAGDAGSFVRRRCRRHPYLLHFLFLRRH